MPPAPAPKPVAVADLAAAIRNAGESGRRIAVIGVERNAGTTLTAIALARALARSARTVAVDLSVSSPNLDVVSVDPAAPGLAELIRGQASFSDVITKDRSSRLHLVATGQVGSDVGGLLDSHMLVPAIEALAHSYDYLVVDAGDASSAAISLAAQVAPRAILVAGAAGADLAEATREHLRTVGFADVTLWAGQPPTLDRALGRSAAA
jgi:Mrp family chromosome partitioning ATPase